MEITDESFEDGLARRLRSELDRLEVSLPGTPTLPSRVRRYFLRSTLAAAIAAGLCLGSAAVSGSPNPVVWVQAAGHSLGLPKGGPMHSVNRGPSTEKSSDASESGRGSAGATKSPSSSHQEKESPEPVEASGGEAAESD